MPHRIRARTACGALALAILGACLPPQWGANALLRPGRRPLDPAATAAAPPHEDVAFTSGGLTLRGWLFRAPAPRRGLLVYLHGISDNRQGGAGIARRYGPLGWDVLAYDQRAHGESQGDACTYGFHEKADLARALDELPLQAGAGRVVVLGMSLGGSVALQAAAADPRVRAVVAVAPFSDLERIARERAPFFVREGDLRAALRLAEMEGRFQVAAVSPVRLAPQVRVPVLLVHGAEDKETRPAHSRALDAALGGPHELVLVPGATHGTVLSAPASWAAISRFLAALP
jgi:uncharacterized protein